MSRRAFEASDAAPAVALIGLAICGAIVIVGLLLAGVAYRLMTHGEHEPAPATNTAPEPRLEEAPGQVRARVERAAQAHLQGYGWTGPGLAHVPIDRAIQLTAQHGWRDAEAAP
jgi:hypothetical protein